MKTNDSLALRNHWLVLAFCLGGTIVHAANIWDGGGTGSNWNTANNWDNNLVPSFPQALTFAGTTQLNPNNDLSSVTVNGFTFSAGAGTFTIGGNDITLGGNITNNSTSLQTINLNMAYAGTTGFSLSANSGDVKLGGNIGGTGALVAIFKYGTHTLTLSGTNSYDNQTRILDGVVKFDSPNAMSPNSNLILSGGVIGLGTGNSSFTRALSPSLGDFRWVSVGGSTSGGFAAYGAERSVNIGGNVTPSTMTWGSTSYFIPNGWTFILGATDADATLDFQNPVNLGTSGTNTRTIRVDNGSATIDAKLSGAITGNANQTLAKTGTGTLALTGANSYSGPTTVTGGTLLVNGTHTGAGAYTVASGATLGGNGTITTTGGVTVDAGGPNGTLAPGASVGELTVNGTVNLDGTLSIEIDGTGADKLIVNGLLNLDGSTSVLNISFINGFTPTGAETFDILDWSSLEGSFSQINLVQPGSFFTWNTGNLLIDGTIALEIPEPASALLLGMAGLGLFSRRARG